MKTAFSRDRFEFTKLAHLAAREQFYARMFPNGVDFEDTTETVRDLDYAIDCQLAVNIPDRTVRAPIRLSVQERFRKPEEMHWGDVTITEWNLATDQPSELHKLGAQLFVYGFYDKPLNRITFATAIDIARVQLALSRGSIDWGRQRRGDQSFIGLPFRGPRGVQECGAVLFMYDARTCACEICGGDQPDAPVQHSGREDGWIHHGCADREDN